MNNKVTGIILFTHIMYVGDDFCMRAVLKSLSIYFQYLISDLQIRLVCWGS